MASVLTKAPSVTVTFGGREYLLFYSEYLAGGGTKFLVQISTAQEEALKKATSGTGQDFRKALKKVIALALETEGPISLDRIQLRTETPEEFRQAKENRGESDSPKKSGPLARYRQRR